MLVFIDESGDAGMKLTAGSSEYFVITLLGFVDHSEAERADNHISQLRQQWRLHEKFEFKFNSLDRRRKEAFLTEMATFNFSYWGIVINKRNLTGEGFKYKDPFYKYACKLACFNAKTHLEDAVIVIDGSGSREFRNQMQTYLKRNLNESDADCVRIRKVKMDHSHKNNLLQLADMISGSVARSYKNKSDARVYRDILRRREMVVQFWPK